MTVVVRIKWVYIYEMLSTSSGSESTPISDLPPFPPTLLFLIYVLVNVLLSEI